jgi:hypothetical protein
MATANRKHPRREEIERRAYEKYLERGQRDGQDIDDWLIAENELSESLQEASVSVAPLVKSRSISEK